MAEVGGYFYISQKDEKRAKAMFDIEDYSACGRFCEQSVEKSLKAFIEIKGNGSDKKLFQTHKPIKLYKRCVQLGLCGYDEQTAGVLSRFDDYYYDTNYPGPEYFELTKEDAEEALEYMKKVNRLVAPHFTTSTPPQSERHL